MDTKKKFLLIIALAVIGSFFGFLKSQTDKDVKLFNVAQPSHGPFIELMNVDVSFTGNIGSAIISKNQAQLIKRRQKVILYDKNSIILPVGGEVRTFKDIGDGVKISIFTPKGTKTELLKNQVSIITREINNKKRLPKTAIQINENGQPYVWRAQKMDEHNGYAVEKIFIDVSLENGTLFVEQGSAISSKDLIVTNPDDEISEDGKYQVNVINLDFPLHNPIKQAWVDFELNQLKQEQVALQKQADECGTDKAKNAQAGDVSTSISSNSGSCGAGTLSTDPFVIFQNLTGQVTQ